MIIVSCLLLVTLFNGDAGVGRDDLPSGRLNINSMVLSVAGSCTCLQEQEPPGQSRKHLVES